MPLPDDRPDDAASNMEWRKFILARLDRMEAKFDDLVNKLLLGVVVLIVIQIVSQFFHVGTP